MRVQAGPDGRPRCAWALQTPEYLLYHDTEWGFPVADDQDLFEKLALEAFQAGLSWRTILEKREGFRRAFRNFDPIHVATFGEAERRQLLQDAGIVRNRAKIDAVIHNAQQLMELTKTQTLASLVWQFEPPRRTSETAPATSPESVAMAKELKRRGWKFIGPTTAYAFMQAMGLVNDHHPACFVHAAVERARQAFIPPTRTG